MDINGSLISHIVIASARVPMFGPRHVEGRSSRHELGVRCEISRLGAPVRRVGKIGWRYNEDCASLALTVMPARAAASPMRSIAIDTRTCSRRTAMCGREPIQGAVLQDDGDIA